MAKKKASSKATPAYPGNTVFLNLPFDETDPDCKVMVSDCDGVCQVEAIKYGHGESFRIKADPARYRRAKELHQASMCPPPKDDPAPEASQDA